MKGMKPVKVWSGADRVRADMITETLNEQGISAYSESKGSGDYMNIYMGLSVFGNDIYVNEKDVVRAQEIIEVLTSDSGETDSTGKEIQMHSADRRMNLIRIVSLIAAVFILIGAVVPSLVNIFFG